jgi:hypothetical protein
MSLNKTVAGIEFGQFRGEVYEHFSLRRRHFSMRWKAYARADPQRRRSASINA